MTISPRTAEEREAAVERYLEISVPYFEAVEANGGTPWFKSQHDYDRRRYEDATVWVCAMFDPMGWIQHRSLRRVPGHVHVGPVVRYAPPWRSLQRPSGLWPSGELSWVLGSGWYQTDAGDRI